MKAFVMKEPGQVGIETVADAVATNDDVLLKVRMIGLCGTDLNSFRGKNPMVSFPVSQATRWQLPLPNRAKRIRNSLREWTSLFHPTLVAADALPASGSGRMPASSTRRWGCNATAQ